jgi:hypothetical protein
MPRAKRTIVRDSLFGQRGEGAAFQGIKEDDEAKARQTGVWLTEQDLEWLDSRCREVRRGGWRGVTRSAFIRALVRAVQDRSFERELAGVAGEAELVNSIKRTLQRRDS